MELNFYTLSVIYLVYSFLGWVGETVVATAKGRRFTNRCTTANGGITPIKNSTWTATSACNILPCGACWAQ